MMENLGVTVVSSGTLAMLFLEGIKWVIRLVKRDTSLDFDPKFYTVMLAVLNALMPFVVVFGLGFQSDDPVLTLSLLGVVRYLLVVALGAIASVITYQQGLKPLKTYAKTQKFLADREEIVARLNEAIKGVDSSTLQ